MQSGLEIIGNRSEALSRFMAAYSRLARLPPPREAALELSSLIRRTAALETRLPVYVERGPAVTLQRGCGPARAAPDQPGAQRRRTRPWRPTAGWG